MYIEKRGVKKKKGEKSIHGKGEGLYKQAQQIRTEGRPYNRHAPERQ